MCLHGDGLLSKIKVNSPVFRAVQGWASEAGSRLTWVVCELTLDLPRVRMEMWSLVCLEGVLTVWSERSLLTLNSYLLSSQFFLVFPLTHRSQPASGKKPGPTLPPCVGWSGCLWGKSLAWSSALSAVSSHQKEAGVVSKRRLERPLCPTPTVPDMTLLAGVWRVGRKEGGSSRGELA